MCGTACDSGTWDGGSDGGSVGSDVGVGRYVSDVVVVGGDAVYYGVGAVAGYGNSEAGYGSK